VAPEANVAVSVTKSSFSTGSRTSDNSAAACPTAALAGTARSVMNVDSTAPRTEVIGPQTNSERSRRWLPTSDSTPEPGPPLYRQLIGPNGLTP
jgi:hypothetical protein